MSANETQIGGTHYTDMPIQPWDFMQSCMSAEQFSGYLLGNVIKYAARHQAKGGVEDLRKARHYLDKLIEVCEKGRQECAELLKDAIQKMDEVLNPSPQEWPGPDWSQAPGWAMWWAKDLSNTRHGCWFDKEPQCNEVEPESTDRYVRGGYWSLGRDGSLFKWSSDQGYPGHWRDSLHKRPSEGGQ